QVIDSLLKEYWPTFLILSQQTQREWIYGTYQRNCREDSLLQIAAQHAAVSFATAVELELKSRVFDKFREIELSKSGLPSSVSRTDKPEVRIIHEFLNRDKISLGQMKCILKQARNSGETISKRFSDWVERNHPDIRRNLKWLESICEIRNLAAHSRIPVESANQMPSWCRTFLDALVAPGSFY